MATETLRPNAVGDVTQLGRYGGTFNWDRVDEATPDEGATIVYAAKSEDKYDLYGLPDSEVGVGIINSVTVYFRCHTSVSGEGRAKIKTSGAEHSGDAEALGSFETFSKQWTTNPQVGGAWTWAQINALQIGVRLTGSADSTANCTQVYVEVDYSDAPDPQLGIEISMTWIKDTTAIFKRYLKEF